VERFSIEPRGAFGLAQANTYFGGWPTLSIEPDGLVMAFPVEEWRTSAAIVIRQEPSGLVVGEVHGPQDDAEAAWKTALAALSLDHDGSAFPEVGQRDPVIGRLQEHFGLMRPVCFHSPYEAGAAFVIGRRMSIVQTRSVRAKLSAEHGDAIVVGDQEFHAFPRPQVLLELDRFGPIFGEKMDRLHGIAEAALAGRLDRARLRDTPYTAAFADLLTLHGVGPFIAQGILIRGAGLPDELSDDEVTAQAVQYAYELPAPPNRAALEKLAEPWRPYRAWAMVLLHMWLRREGGPGFQRPGRQRSRSSA
jgi:DNA-3-methyladenine glycosylase II